VVAAFFDVVVAANFDVHAEPTADDFQLHYSMSDDEQKPFYQEKNLMYLTLQCLMAADDYYLPLLLFASLKAAAVTATAAPFS